MSDQPSESELSETLRLFLLDAQRNIIWPGLVVIGPGGPVAPDTVSAVGRNLVEIDYGNVPFVLEGSKQNYIDYIAHLGKRDYGVVFKQANGRIGEIGPKLELELSKRMPTVGFSYGSAPRPDDDSVDTWIRRALENRFRKEVEKRVTRSSNPAIVHILCAKEDKYDLVGKTLDDLRSEKVGLRMSDGSHESQVIDYAGPLMNDWGVYFQNAGNHLDYLAGECVDSLEERVCPNKHLDIEVRADVRKGAETVDNWISCLVCSPPINTRDNTSS